MKYQSIIKNFTEKNILIIGDVMLDHFIWGDVNRISPEAPVPVVDVRKESYLIGGAGNVAHNVRALGASVTIVGVIGDDFSASQLKDEFIQKGISIDGLFIDMRPTTIKTRVIANNQQVVRFDREDNHDLDKRLLNKIIAYIEDIIDSHDAIIISDYKKGVISSALVKRLNEMARKRGIFIAVDPKVGNFHYYKGISLITPNRKEASEASGIDINDERTLTQAGRKLQKTLRCRSVLITRGENGMTLFHDEDIVNIPTVARAVYDVTGAGDTVISVFTLAHVSGADMTDAAVISNHAAGIVVGELGTAVVTRGSLLASLRDL